MRSFPSAQASQNGFDSTETAGALIGRGQALSVVFSSP
jgi:hypothetical protein